MASCQQFRSEIRSGSGCPGAAARRSRAPARYTKEGLLDLVVAVFNERGYEAASMEDLAKASGFTKSTFYHHVSGKEELLRMAVNRALDALSAALDETLGADGTPVEQLEDAIRRTTAVLLAELPYVTLLLRVRGNTEIEREALTRRRAIDARLADAGHRQQSMRVRSGPTSIPGWSAGCCSAWSTPSPSGTGPMREQRRGKGSSTPSSDWLWKA